jgi:16S rRNA (cytidine1402-2'-O)-methyltransferase
MPKMTEESAALYVVPTPLGNLADITRRAEEILRVVPWVAAEDTRHSAPLLKHLGSSARMLPAHQHNEHEAAARIVARLLAGEPVALVSDAGTPGISDPGARIVAAVRAAGCRVVPLPGPCAAIAALSAAGLADEHFLFWGFLPSKGGQRRKALEGLRDQSCALVFYEAPHRVLETVADLAAVLGERTLVIARELTKLFESIHSGPLTAALAWLLEDANRQRGEFVLIVSGAPAAADSGEGERVLKLLLADGLPVRQAAKLAAAITGAAKNALYERALEIRAQEIRAQDDD